MSSAAIPAQGTTLHIAGTAGGAKTITGVSVGFPAVVTSAAHGLANGDVVAIAAITGTIGSDATNGLNGKSFVISHVLTNSFVIEANTTGLVYTSGGTATPSTWTKVGNIKTIKPSGSSASEIDVTDLDSTGKEFRTGLKDPGTCSLENFCLDSDAGQAAMLAAFTSQAIKTFKITYPSGATPVRTFSALVKKFPEVGDIGIDNVINGSIELRLSGSVAVS